MKRNIFNRIKGDVEKMSDKEFLSQNGFYELLRSQITSILKKGERVEIEFESSETNVTAYTDGQVVHCNTWSPLVLPCETRYLKYLSNIGSASHECGHVLYTDFSLLNRIRSYIRNELFIFPNSDNFYKRNKYVKNFFKNEMCDIINIIEDMYIEHCLMLEYPECGILVQGLKVGNKVKYDLSPSLKVVEEKVESGEILLLSVFTAMLQIKNCLGYEIKDVELCSGEIHDKLMDALKSAESITEDYKLDYDRVGVERNIKKLAEIAYSLLPSDEELLSKNNSANSSEQGENDEQSGQGDSQNNDQSQNGQSGDQNSNQSSGNSNQCGNQDGQPGGQSDSQEMSSQEQEEKMGKLSSESNELKKSCGMSNRNENAHNYNEKRKPDETGENSEQKEQMNLSSEEMINKEVAKNINEIANKEAENENIKKQTNETMKKYFPDSGLDVKNIDFSKSKSNNLSDYLEYYDEIKQTSKSCQRLINQVLNKRNDEESDSGYVMGNKFNVNDYYRKDGKYFSKNMLPDDMPDAVFSILVDCSGSMSGNKIYAARKTAILFDDICNGLKIPHIVSGHCERNGDVIVDNCVTFNSRSKDKYSIGDLRAGGRNTDTITVSLKANELLNRSEKTKVLIVISDGLPCDDGCRRVDNFMGVPFKNDDEMGYNSKKLNACIRYWRKKGINIVGISIDQIKNIKKIYERDILDCTDLQKLPSSMAKLFKRFIINTKN